MRVDMSDRGTLTITPDEPAERFMLRVWSELWAQKKAALHIVTDRADEPNPTVIAVAAPTVVQRPPEDPADGGKKNPGLKPWAKKVDDPAQ